MTYSFYSNGEYAFLNGAVEKTPDVCHAYVFEPVASRAAFDLADARAAIAAHGGMLLTNTGIRECVGNYHSCGDYWIGRGFTAYVYNNDKKSRIKIASDFTGPIGERELISPVSVSPTGFQVNDFFRAVGNAPTTFAGFGSEMVGTIQLNQVSGMTAKYYAFKKGQLIGAFGIYGQHVPWLYYPKNREAGRGVFAIATGDSEVVPNLKYAPGLTLDYCLPDLKESGVIFAADTRTNAARTKNEIQQAKELSDLAWSKRFALPSFSNDDVEYEAIAQWCVDSVKPDEPVEGVVYYGPDADATLTSAISQLIESGSDRLTLAHGFLVDTVLNRLFTESKAIYDEALHEFWSSEYQSMLAGATQILYTAQGVLVAESAARLQEAVNRATEALSAFASASNQVNCSLVLSPSLPNLPQLGSGSTDDMRRAVQEGFANFGCGMDANTNVLCWTGAHDEQLKREFRNKILPTLQLEVTKAFSSVADHFTKGSLTISDNTEEHHYTNLLFQDKVQEHDIYPQTSWPNIAQRIHVQKSHLYTVSMLAGRAAVDLECVANFADAIWRPASYRDWPNDFAGALQACLPAGYSVVLKGTTWADDEEEFHFLPKMSDIKTFGGINQLFWNYCGDDPSWIPIGGIRFSVHYEFSYEPNVAISIADDGAAAAAQAIVARKTAAGAAEASAKALAIFVPRLDEIIAESRSRPLCLVKGYYVTPRTAAAFFNIPILGCPDLEEIYNTMWQTDLDAETKEKMKQLFTELQSSLQIDNVTKVGWCTEQKILTAEGSPDSDLVPLYIYLGGC